MKLGNTQIVGILALTLLAVSCNEQKETAQPAEDNDPAQGEAAPPQLAAPGEIESAKPADGAAMLEAGTVNATTGDYSNKVLGVRYRGVSNMYKTVTYAKARQDMIDLNEQDFFASEEEFQAALKGITSYYLSLESPLVDDETVAQIVMMAEPITPEIENIPMEKCIVPYVGEAILPMKDKGFGLKNMEDPKTHAINGREFIRVEVELKHKEEGDVLGYDFWGVKHNGFVLVYMALFNNETTEAKEYKTEFLRILKDAEFRGP